MSRIVAIQTQTLERLLQVMLTNPHSKTLVGLTNKTKKLIFTTKLNNHEANKI